MSVTASHEAFTKYIRHLLLYDFNKLVQLLYRIDVDETKLKSMLKDADDAAVLIANLIIQRQIEKINRSMQTKLADDISDEERW